MFFTLFANTLVPHDGETDRRKVLFLHSKPVSVRRRFQPLFRCQPHSSSVYDFSGANRLDLWVLLTTFRGRVASFIGAKSLSKWSTRDGQDHDYRTYTTFA